MTLLQQIQTSLAACNITAEKTSSAPLAVALSGGADSVCLLLSLKELGFTTHALHCNFELRGLESDADEAFCRRLCRQLEVPISVKHFRTASYAKRHSLSIEMAARELRYHWFEQQMNTLSAEALCVAHHRDDQAETILLNLTRGTGIRGLCGMQQLNAKRVVRPLLHVSRSEIEAWLNERGQTWVTDSTNLDPEAARRNIMRLEVLPALQRINPTAAANIAESGERMSEALKLYEFAISQQRALVEHNGAIDIAALKASIAPCTLLYELLRDYGFTPEQSRNIFDNLDGEPGHEWQSSECRLLRNRGKLLLKPKGSAANDIGNTQADDEEGCYLPLEGLYQSRSGTRLLIRRHIIDPATYAIPHDASTACFDLEKLTLPLTLRPTREGDRFQPFGMEGTRLVSDLLTDRKLSVFEKEQQQVVCSGEKIAWVVGLRVAAGFEVDEHTRHVMTLTCL